MDLHNLPVVHNKQLHKLIELLYYSQLRFEQQCMLDMISHRLELEQPYLA